MHHQPRANAPPAEELAHHVPQRDSGLEFSDFLLLLLLWDDMSSNMAFAGAVLFLVTVFAKRVCGLTLTQHKMISHVRHDSSANSAGGEADVPFGHMPVLECGEFLRRGRHDGV
jgi:hypothetical protein